ncbi:MAG: DUF1553 domain-containing protein [Verrucomicrobia bacterium]|nr:DUF1553 domain-containing protein [Verrucomicrobiota bacterium]
MRASPDIDLSSPARWSRKLWLFPTACLLSLFLTLASATAGSVPSDLPGDTGSHWAFRPVVVPPVPKPLSGWGINPIDAFVGLRHQERGLVPSDPAPPQVLIRRLYLDLIGVPPTPAELDEFTSNPTDDHYVRIVERLLASPRHGERWGRHWMDVWRYSDWAGHGAEVRESHPHIWRWRDWIIESLNADKPYDRMLLEMLAADELAPLDASALRATGFLVRNWFRYNRNVWLESTVEHTGKAFLGVTFNCAKCHDSKSDPMSQVDFYRMRAFFEPYDIRTNLLSHAGDASTNSLVQAFDGRLADPTYVFTRGDEARPETNQPVLPQLPSFLGKRSLDIAAVDLPLDSYYPALSEPAVKVVLARSEEEALAAEKKADGAWSTALSATNDVESLRNAAEVASRQAALSRARQVALRHRVLAERVKYAVVPGDAETSARAAAGAERQAGVAAAELGVAEALAAFQSLRVRQKQSDPKADPAADPKEVEKAQKALADAEKKTKEAQEKLAAARREALEPSTSYASLGPVYPRSSSGRRLALARWIASPENPLTARVAMNHIWMRHFGSPLVATVFDFGKAGQAPSHPELLDWLAGEFVRQGWSMKAMHRLLVTSATYRMKSSGGAMMSRNLASDPDNIQLWQMNVRRAEAEVVRDSVLHVAGGLDWTMGGPELDPGAGESLSRRSVYFRHAKEKAMEFTQTFDGPGMSECYRRNASVVPQQALAMANSVLVKTQSRRLAKSISDTLRGEAEDAEFIHAAFAGILSRKPTVQETAACREFLKEQAGLLADPSRLTPAAVGEASKLAPAGESKARARENLILVLFNHNDFVSIR